LEKYSSLISATNGVLALQGKDKNTIYLFGGTISHGAVHKFDPITNVTVRLPTGLPSSIRYAGGVSINGTILIFDGFGSRILEFSEETETATIIAELSFDDNDNSPTVSVAALPDDKDSIWLFAGSSRKPTNPILLFNTTTKTANIPIPTANTTSMPTLYYRPASVSDGSHGYLIGGIGRTPEEDGSFHPGNGILR
jgi:hypothetical protein